MKAKRRVYSVYVEGRPVPQGSMKSYGPRRLVSSNHTILHPWRELVACAARVEPDRPRAQIEGPVGLRLAFVFKRPPSHFTIRGQLTRSAPLFPGRNCGDVDKLERAVLDALTGVWYHDDTQVVSVLATKQYGDRDCLLIDCWEET